MNATTLPAPPPAPAPHTRRMPGEEGIWLFIFGDLMMFSLLFAVFLYYRGQDVDLYTRSQAHLNQVLGVLNTFFMLTSSWFVAMAVHAARTRPGRTTPVLLGLAFACGVGFGVVKVVEYSEKIRAGITLATNDFYMYYFIFTGIHFVHVLFAMAVLVFLIRHVQAGPLDATRMRNLESGASFWHVIDLLWIVLFALLYLVK